MRERAEALASIFHTVVILIGVGPELHLRALGPGHRQDHGVGVVVALRRGSADHQIAQIVGSARHRVAVDRDHGRTRQRQRLDHEDDVLIGDRSVGKTVDHQIEVITLEEVALLSFGAGSETHQVGCLIDTEVDVHRVGVDENVTSTIVGRVVQRITRTHHEILVDVIVVDRIAGGIDGHARIGERTGARQNNDRQDDREDRCTRTKRHDFSPQWDQVLWDTGCQVRGLREQTPAPSSQSVPQIPLRGQCNSAILGEKPAF